jgi:hypothetical protein
MTKFQDFIGPTWTLYPSGSVQSAEQDLYESVVVEHNDIYGFEVDYYVLDLEYDGPDAIYGENQNEKYRGPYRTKVIYAPTNEFSPAEIFGISVDQPLHTVQIPHYTFIRDVYGSVLGGRYSGMVPVAGDLMHMLWNNFVYAITDISHEDQIFLAKKFVWNLTLRPYKTTLNEPTSAYVDVDNLTSALPLSAWGDNDVIEELSDDIDNYVDLPDLEDVYGYN